VKLRSDVDRPPVWLSEPGDDDSERPTPEHDSFHADSIIVDGESRADRVGIADVSGADDDRSFLAEPDFDTETVYVETIRVQECFRIQLCRISWASDEIHTNYGRTLRPYDEQCGVEERVYVAVFIRIPDALEEESVNSYGSSLGGGGCRAGRGAAGGGGGDASMSSGASSASTGGEDDPTPAETTDAVTRTATNETGGGQ
jgi:hypothetical protein